MIISQINYFNDIPIRSLYDPYEREWSFSVSDLTYAMTKQRNNVKTYVDKNTAVSLARQLNEKLIEDLKKFVEQNYAASRKYTLKHKDIDVVEIEIDYRGDISAIAKIYNTKHAPIGSAFNGEINIVLLQTWWHSRSIPASRKGLVEFLRKVGFGTPQQLLEKSLGLSLSDQYWIAPVGSNLKWEDVNFFDNEFSQDIGDILFGRIEKKSTDKINLMTPDNTSDGVLKKRWKIVDGKRCLIKSGGEFNQEVANEVLATKICKRLNIPHAKYSLISIDDRFYNICPDFIDQNTELVSAWSMVNLVEKPDDVSIFQYFINICVNLGIKDIKYRVAQMIVLDFIIANTDRHYNNFGLVRNADTLKWIGFAPIYDSGSSMWSTLPDSEIIPRAKNIVCSSFSKTLLDQLKYIDDFAWLDLDALDGIEQEYKETLQIIYNRSRNKSRINRLARALRTRIELLRNFIVKKKLS
jgi:hypothetical protein